MADGTARAPDAQSRRNVGLNVRVARLQQGWSLHEFSIRAGIKAAYVGSIERCEINLGIDNLDRIARGLGLPAHVLVRRPDEARELLSNPDAVGRLGRLCALRLQNRRRVQQQRAVIERLRQRRRDTRLAQRLLNTMLEHQRQLAVLIRTLQRASTVGTGGSNDV